MLWFSLAKALFRSGNTDDAMIAAKQANDLDESIRQIAVCVRAWRERRFIEDRKDKEGPAKTTLEKVIEKIQKHVDKIREKESTSSSSGGRFKEVPKQSKDKSNDEEEMLNYQSKAIEVAMKPLASSPPIPEEPLSNLGVEESDSGEAEGDEEYAPLRPSSQDSFRTMSPSLQTDLLGGDDEFTLASQSFGRNIISGSFRITQATGGRKRRNNTKRISDFVSSQLTVELVERKRKKKQELETLKAQKKLEKKAEEKRERQELEEKYESLPLWKQKHMEMKRKKIEATKKFKEKDKVVSLINAFKMNDSRR